MQDETEPTIGEESDFQKNLKASRYTAAELVEQMKNVPPPMEESSNPPSVTQAAVVEKQPNTVGTLSFGSGKLSETMDRSLCVLMHAAGGIFWFMPPLIVWLLKRHESPAVDAHGKAAINFQLTAFIVAVICGFVSCGVGVFIPWFFSIVLAVVAAARASSGEVFKYPLSIKFVK